MYVAQASEPAISEPLTWDQIRERYPDEWVCLAEIGWLNDTAGEGRLLVEPLVAAAP